MSTSVFPSNFIIWSSIQWQKAIDNNISEWNLVKIYMYDEKLFQCSYTKSKFPRDVSKIRKAQPKIFLKKETETKLDQMYTNFCCKTLCNSRRVTITG